MDMDAIEARLCNWARQYKPGFTKAVCGSIEGKLYRAPWRQWVELSEMPYSAPIDWRDAEIVEQAWRGLMGTPKLLLKYTYMSNFPPHVVARKCGVKRWNLEIELAKAKRVIASVLDKKTLLTYTVIRDTLVPQFEPSMTRKPPRRVVLARQEEAEAA